MKRLLFASLIGSCLLFSQEADEKEDLKNPVAGQPEAIAAGRKLFVNGCAGCHGPNADGGRGPNLSSSDLVRAATNRHLFNSIKNGVKGTDMPPSSAPDDQIWRMLAFLRNISSPAIESKLAGDVEAGGALFWGKAGCSGCHMIRGRGGYLGPDLSNVGRSRSAGELRESILKPDERIADGYRGVTVTLRDGKKISGAARDNTNYAIQILDAKGDLHLLAKQDVREVVFHRGSPMPKDYPQRLAGDDLQNLLAYLSRQSMRPATSGDDGSGSKNR